MLDRRHVGSNALGGWFAPLTGVASSIARRGCAEDRCRPRVRAVPRQSISSAGPARRARPPAGTGQRRRHGTLCPAPPRSRQAAGPRADRAAHRRGRAVLGAVDARRLAQRGVLRRRVGRDRSRCDLGHRVHHHRPRPNGSWRRDQPDRAEEDLASDGHLQGEPVAARGARRVGRRRPADPSRAVHASGCTVPQPHPAVCDGGADHLARVRQLHGWRCLHARHERLRRDGPRAGEGVPRGPSTGEDGHG